MLENQTEKSKRRLSQCFKRLVLLSLVVALIVGTLLSPVFAVKDVTIVGTNYIDKGTLEKRLPISLGKDNLFKLSKKKIKESVLKEPYASDVQIAKRPLHSLIITITEKTPVAILVTDNASYLIDEKGYLLQVKKESDNFNFPLISGINLEHNEKLGEVLNDDRLQLALKLIGENKEAFSELIQEINIKNHRDILLYTNQGIEVRNGDDKNATERLQKLFDIIEQVVLPRSLNGKIEYVDMRYLSGLVIKMNKEKKTLKADALPIEKAP